SRSRDRRYRRQSPRSRGRRCRLRTEPVKRPALQATNRAGQETGVTGDKFFMANVRICMIGAGRVGKLHSGTLRRHVPGGDVVALVDPWAEVRDATGDEFGIERRFASLEDALDAVEFDAVVITTPTPTHRELAVLAAEH